MFESSAAPTGQGTAGAAGTTYVLELPYLRPPLNHNQRLHFGVKARRTAALRRDAAWLARSAGIPHVDQILVQLHYAPGRRIRIDPMNLTATSKPCIDGLVDAGIVDDDDSSRVHEVTPEIHFPPEPGPRCWLTVTVVGGAG